MAREGLALLSTGPLPGSWSPLFCPRGLAPEVSWLGGELPGANSLPSLRAPALEAPGPAASALGPPGRLGGCGCQSQRHQGPGSPVEEQGTSPLASPRTHLPHGISWGPGGPFIFASAWELPGPDKSVSGASSGYSWEPCTPWAEGGRMKGKSSLSQSGPSGFPPPKLVDAGRLGCPQHVLWAWSSWAEHACAS